MKRPLLPRLPYPPLVLPATRAPGVGIANAGYALRSIIAFLIAGGLILLSVHRRAGREAPGGA